MKHIDKKLEDFDFIARVTKKRSNIKNREDLVLVVPKVRMFDVGYKLIITTDNKLSKKQKNILVVSEDVFFKFNQDDIVSINEKGISFLWEHNSNDNCFFFTESCSCNCIMCPQPPKKHEKALENAAERVLSLLPQTYKNSICITGGEPTIIQEFFLNFIKKIRKKFADNPMIILTNGKTFADYNFINDYRDLNARALVAVSLNADIDTIHDKIVRAKNSFDKTQKGIYNLAKARERIEIRFVISKMNYNRLPHFADFVYKNFPFVTHVALMGLEYTGYASDYYSQISINPAEYSKELSQAVKKLNRYGMRVSIYNVPLCLIDESIRDFAMQSISTWKNEYNPICKDCLLKEQCAGMFTTSCNHPYENIKPIKH